MHELLDVTDEIADARISESLVRKRCDHGELLGAERRRLRRHLGFLVPSKERAHGIKHSCFAQETEQFVVGLGAG